MGSLLTTRAAVAALACSAFGVQVAWALEWELSVDVRVADADGPASFLDGGPGKLRFDSFDDVAQIGRMRFALEVPVSEVLAVTVDASSWGDEDANPFDFTEAYLEYRPYPLSPRRTRMRVGAFYPPTSLANRASGWESAYTLSSSALDSWIAEEIRIVGIEARQEWLGTRDGRSFDFGLVGGVFGWNDPAGVRIAEHGFALHDRQTALFGRVGAQGSDLVPTREVFHELDHRPGFYVGSDVRYFDRMTLRLLHYDNRADPTVYDAGLDDFAWETRFDTAGIRLETPQGWTGIAQWLGGETYIAPGGDRIEWEFESSYLLLSRRFGHHLLTARYDDFTVEQGEPDDEDGQAWTVAYRFERGPRWCVTLEWLRVERHGGGELSPGSIPVPAQSKIELAIRLTMGAE